MNHAEAAPVWQFHSWVQHQVNGDRSIAEQHAATGFKRSTDAAGAAVGKSAINMGLLDGMCANRCSAELLDSGQVAGVIQVSMGEQDCAEATPVQPDLFEGAIQKPHLTGE